MTVMEGNFSGRLRELRLAAGLSQAKLATSIGTTVRTISRLETGAQEPTWPTVLALADALGVTCEAFTQEPARRYVARRGRPVDAARAGAEEPSKRIRKPKGLKQ